MKDDGGPTETMTVRYIHGEKGRWAGGVLWSERAPARNGVFPHNHPCAAGTPVFGAAGNGQCGEGEKLNAFRELGYWASCFPEGDGITLDAVLNQPPAQVIADIEQVFGWRVRRGETSTWLSASKATGGDGDV